MIRPNLVFKYPLPYRKFLGSERLESRSSTGNDAVYPRVALV